MKRILLVDDDDILREQMSRALQRRGYACADVSHGEAAISYVQHHDIDAAVIDLRMPGISGLETVAALHARQPAARLIVLTGYGSIATALEAVRLGAADYLTKPVNADQVAHAIEGKPVSTSISSAEEEAVPSLDMVEWEHIQRVMTDCGGNISKAAQVLGLHRRSLQRKLNRYAPGR